MYTFFLVVLTIVLIVFYLKRWLKTSILLWLTLGYVVYYVALEWGLDALWRWPILVVTAIVVYAVGWIIENSQ